jgi:hypothetical protein
MRKIGTLVVGLIAGVVVGCGGGDGSTANLSNTAGIPTDDLVITEENGQQIAEEVMTVSDDIIEGGAFSSSLLQADLLNPSNSVSGPPSPQTLAVKMARDQLPSSSANTFNNVVSTDSCPGGGTITTTVSDNNNNSQVDAGEFVSISFSNCLEQSTVLNGSMRITFNTIFGDVEFSSGDWTLGLSVQFDDFSASANSESYSIDGGFTLSTSYDASAGVTTSQIQGTNLIYTEGAGIARLSNFDITSTTHNSDNSYTLSYAFTYAGSDIGGVVTVVTNTPFTGQNASAPDSGKLTLTGSNNASVVIEAIGSGRATISIDANGDDDFSDVGDRIIEGEWNVLFA